MVSFLALCSVLEIADTHEVEITNQVCDPGDTGCDETKVSCYAGTLDSYRCVGLPTPAPTVASWALGAVCGLAEPAQRLAQPRGREYTTIQ